MKFAICDDDQNDIIKIKELINKYNMSYIQKIIMVLYDKAEDLLRSINTEQPDCLILDIVMPDINGIELGRMIRKINENIDIIYITSSKEFAVDAYSVYAFNYILKPISEKSVFPVLQKITAKNQNNVNFIIVKYNKDIIKIYIEDIEYCEVINKTVCYHLIDGTVINSNEKMNEVEKALMKYSCFIKPHRSFIVNMNYIKSISKSSICMKCEYELPIPHGKCGEVKNKYINYICNSVEKK